MVTYVVKLHYEEAHDGMASGGISDQAEEIVCKDRSADG